MVTEESTGRPESTSYVGLDRVSKDDMIMIGDSHVLHMNGSAQC